MPDPLSIAAGVAGLVAFAGSTSKFFYQFYRSIHDAPAIARDLTGNLYSLNIALSQIQGALIDPAFVAVSNDEQLVALQECLASCTAIFEQIRARIQLSGLAEDDQKWARKAWESVKASFNEEQMGDYLQRVESEKNTLSLILGIFTAYDIVFESLENGQSLNVVRRLNAGVLTQVRKTQALVAKQGQLLEKQDRRLKDIHVFCQWVVKGPKRQHQNSASSAGEYLQKTAFPLSSAYETEEISNLLQSSGSVLSLTLGDLDTDTVSAVWEPDTRSQLPLRRLRSTLQFGDPPKDGQGLFRSTTQILPSSIELVKAELSKGIPGRKAMALAEMYARLSASGPFKEINGLISPISFTLRNLIQAARNLNQDVLEDLKYMEDSWAQFSNHWIMEQEKGNDPPSLSKLVEELVDAVDKYTVWSTAAMKLDEKSRKARLTDVSVFLKSQPNDSERKRLMARVVRAFEAVKLSQATFVSERLYKMQQEQLELQRKTSTQLESLLGMQGTTAEREKADGTGRDDSAENEQVELDENAAEVGEEHLQEVE